jgi:uncharacterized protein
MIKVNCPICSRTMRGAAPSEWPDFPFCSPKCKLIDLGRWLGGAYAIEDDDQSPDIDLSDADSE